MPASRTTRSAHPAEDGDGTNRMNGADSATRVRDPAPAARVPRRRPARWPGVLQRLAGAAFVLVAMGGIGAVLRGRGGQILALCTGTRAVLLLAAAVVVRTAALPLGMGAWRVLVTGPGTPLPAGTGARIYFSALLGKYIPGPVWGVLASVQVGRRAGIAGGRMVAAYLLNTVVVIVTSAVVGLLCAVQVFGTGALWFAPAVLPAVVMWWRPSLVHRCAARAARLLRRPVPGAGASDAGLRRSMVLETVCWVVAGLHLWLIATALGAPVAAALAVSVGGFALATVAGALTLITPDGAGARELVLTAALSTVLPLARAGAAVVASRICCTVGELLAGGAALLLTRGALPKPPPPDTPLE